MAAKSRKCEFAFCAASARSTKFASVANHTTLLRSYKTGHSREWQRI
jgi:hypothetical protein